MRVSRLFVIGAFMLALLPASASAQGWTFTPFIGSNFGGNADFGEFATFDDEFEKRVDFGGTLGWLSAPVSVSKSTSATRRTSSKIPAATWTSISATAT